MTRTRWTALVMLAVSAVAYAVAGVLYPGSRAFWFLTAVSVVGIAVCLRCVVGTKEKQQW